MQARFSRKLRVSEARDLAHRAEHGDWSAGQELTERVYSWNREIAKTDDEIKKIFPSLRCEKISECCCLFTLEG